MANEDVLERVGGKSDWWKQPAQPAIPSANAPGSTLPPPTFSVSKAPAPIVSGAKPKSAVTGVLPPPAAPIVAPATPPVAGATPTLPPPTTPATPAVAPAPVVTPPPAAEAPRAATVQPVATAQTVTPAETVGADGYTDAQRADIEAQQASASTTKAAEVNAANTAAADAAKAKTDPYAALIDQAKSWSVATEDPIAKAKMNSAVEQLGMHNATAAQEWDARINSDPELRGQGAGNAMLQVMARDAGVTMSQLVSGLNIESMQRVADLNKHGFEQLQQLTQQRESYRKSLRDDMLAAGDVDGWADAFEEATGIKVDRAAIKAQSPATLQAIDTLSQAINNNIKGGDIDRAKQLFEQMRLLDPAQFGALTFEDYANAKEIWRAGNEEKQKTLTNIRELVAQKNLPEAINGLQSLYDEDESALEGRKLLTDGMALEEANRLLTQAGYQAVESLDDMVGLEDELYISKKLDEMVAADSKTNWMDQSVSTMQQMLAGTDFGTEATTPEGETALRTYLLNLQTNGGITFDAQGNAVLDYSKLLPPWDPKSPSATLFSAWPDPGTGDPSNPDSYDFPDDLPSEATSPESYARNSALDGAYARYIRENPSAEERLSRAEWYAALHKDFPGMDSETAGKLRDILAAWSPKSAPGTDSGVDWKSKTVSEIGDLIKGQADPTAIDWSAKSVKDWVTAQPALLPSQIGNAETFAKSNLGKYIKLDGKMYRVDAGAQQWYSGSQNEKRHRDYMTLTGQDGQVIYVGSDGRQTTTPPPQGKGAKGADQFKAWYNSMKAA